MNLLVLPFKNTIEDQGLWREAIRRGWKTLRLSDKYINEPFPEHDMVRYYGNILHKVHVEKRLPITFTPISDGFLSDLDISWTDRKIERALVGDIKWPLKEDAFIKCVDIKWLEAKVYKAGEQAPTQWKSMLPTDKIYVQEVKQFINEVRCFVLDREVVTASYYRKNKEFCPENVDLENIAYIRSLSYGLTSPYMSTSLPRGVVLDFGQDDRGLWSLVEANEAWASGLYDCDPSKVFDVVVASQENKI